MTIIFDLLCLGNHAAAVVHVLSTFNYKVRWWWYEMNKNLTKIRPRCVLFEFVDMFDTLGRCLYSSQCCQSQSREVAANDRQLLAHFPCSFWRWLSSSTKQLIFFHLVWKLLKFTTIPLTSSNPNSRQKLRPENRLKQEMQLTSHRIMTTMWWWVRVQLEWKSLLSWLN